MKFHGEIYMLGSMLLCFKGLGKGSWKESVRGMKRKTHENCNILFYLKMLKRDKNFFSCRFTVFFATDLITRSLTDFLLKQLCKICCMHIITSNKLYSKFSSFFYHKKEFHINFWHLFRLLFFLLIETNSDTKKMQ